MPNQEDQQTPVVETGSGPFYAGTTQAVLIDVMASCLEKMPPDGRVPAIRYLLARYAPDLADYLPTF